MTKYLINLVCIIGVAGAAHAGAVANLEITPDGHAYLVFADTGNGELTGYTIEDIAAVPTLNFLRPAGVEDGTGQYATAWASLEDQGAFSGELLGAVPAPDDWFVEGVPALTTFLGEVNIDGHLARAAGAPVYIGQILDTTAMGGVITGADFLGGGRLENLEVSVSDTNEVVDVAAASLMVANPLVTGITDLTGTPYQETGVVGASGTHFDATFTSMVSPGVYDSAVIDLEVGAIAGVTVIDDDKGNADPADDITTTTTLLEGSVMVNGTLVQVTTAELVETVEAGALLSGSLRLQAVDGPATIAIDASLTETATDALGASGTLGSTMIISLVPGDFDLDGDCDADDIDAISALGAGPNSLLYDG